MSTQLTVVQQGWLALADTKQKVADRLHKMELSLQLKTDLKEYKKGLDELVEFRIKFTNQITNALIKPMMDYENRAKEHYVKMQANDLEERKIRKQQEQEAQALEEEKALYRIALVKYYSQKEQRYVQACYNVVNHFLAKGDKEGCFKELAEVKPTAEKPDFTGTLITDEMKREIASLVVKPDFNMHYANIKADAEKYFEMGIGSVEKDTTEIEAKAAIETLSIKAETPKIISTKVKTFSKVEVSTQEEAKAVIVAFLQCYNYWDKLIKVRSWDSLCDKMAAAVAKHHDETGEIFEGLTFKTVEK